MPETIGLNAIINTSKFDRGVKLYTQGLIKMQASTDKLVRGSVTVKDAEGNLIRYSTATARAGVASDKAGTSFQQAALKAAALVAALGVVNKLQQFAGESFEAGRAQNDMRNALIQTVGSVEEYNRLIAAGQQSTKGMVSETKLAEAGMVLLKSGIAGSSEEVGRLSAAGTALVNTYANLGANQEKLTRFILSGNQALFDNFNFTKQQVAAKVAEIEATTNLSGEEAKLAARKALVIQEGEKLLGTVSAETIQINQLSAAYDDFQAAFGQVLISLNQATGAIPAVTGAFQSLTEGAKAWSYVLNEAIPAIEQHNAGLAAQAAQAALSAGSQEELSAAWQQGRSDFDTFTSKLLAGSGNVEEYNEIIKAGTQGNYLLADSLTMTTEEFDAAKAAIADAVVASNQWVSSISAMNITAVAQQVDNYADSIYGLEIRTREAAQAQRELNQAQSNANLRAAKEKAPELGVRIGEGRTAAFELAQQREQAETRANERIAKSSQQAARSFAKPFEDAAKNITSVIENVVQPTLSEVWQPPVDEARFDENARRLATVATSGFGSEWLNQLNTQFAGMDFWQPITQAMAMGDTEALKQAATDLLTNNVTALWDVEAIKNQVRAQLQQQKLRENIIAQIQAELSGEGGISTVVPAAIDAGLQGLEEQLPEFLPPWTATFEEMEGVVKDKDWQGLGKSIDTGVLAGIRQNKHLIIEELKALVQDALIAAQNAIGSHSPATALIPLGASIPQGMVVGMQQQSGAFQSAFDELFGITRNSASWQNILGQTADDLEKVFDSKKIEGSKVELALRQIKAVFRANSKEILTAGDRLGKFREILKRSGALGSWLGKDAGQKVQQGLGDFFRLWDRNMKKASDALQANIISGATKALSLAGSLSDLAMTGATQLNSEIDMLAQLLNTGASDFMLDGQLISATEATDLLNQKMREQADIQDDLLQLQQSQAQLAFLEKQLDLIKTINQAGLNPADVLGGADLSTVGGLVTATNAAIQAIIGQVGQDISAYTPVGGGQAINNTTSNVNMGGVVINNGMDLATLQALIRRTVAQGMG